MDNIEIGDPEFRDAVAAIDAGDVAALERLLAEHPRLVRDRLEGGEGYFKNPYLLWFVAENPVRNDSLPANITDVTRVIVDAARGEGVDSLKQQLEYALGLVASGRVARESGAQGALIDLLCGAGADPNGSLVSALAHREIDAAECLLSRGATMTLFAAACLKRPEAFEKLLESSTAEARQGALTGAALHGDADALRALIAQGVDVNAYSPGWCHPHATPLHHAVDSGSLDAVRVLVEAGAPLEVRDRVYGGDAVGWAEHLGLREIELYLRAVAHDAPGSRDEGSTSGTPRVRRLVAMVSVSDLPRSIAFYEKLGFLVRNTFEPSDGSGVSWAYLEADSTEIMLSRASAPIDSDRQAVLFYAYFDDVVAAKAALEAAGVGTGELMFPFYAPKGEFQVTDPDGFVVMVTHT